MKTSRLDGLVDGIFAVVMRLIKIMIENHALLYIQKNNFTLGHL